MAEAERCDGRRGKERRAGGVVLLVLVLVLVLLFVVVGSVFGSGEREERA
jgi:hypothetical protein